MSRDEGPSVLGWREWVELPALGTPPIKAKLDTGARTSALHAYDLVEIQGPGGEQGWLEFSFHPVQDRSEPEVRARARIVDQRQITSSNGLPELRYVVATEAIVERERFELELSLSNRDQMGFRMLLGRTALRGRFLVDPRRSYRGAVSKRIKAEMRRTTQSR